MDRYRYPKGEVLIGAADRENISCFMHDTRFCRIDVKMTYN